LQITTWRGSQIGFSAVTEYNTYTQVGHDAILQTAIVTVGYYQDLGTAIEKVNFWPLGLHNWDSASYPARHPDLPPWRVRGYALRGFSFHAIDSTRRF
jgi:hypothetical protein